MFAIELINTQVQQIASTEILKRLEMRHLRIFPRQPEALWWKY